jgi:hypothetical protein
VSAPLVLDADDRDDRPSIWRVLAAVVGWIGFVVGSVLVPLGARLAASLTAPIDGYPGGDGWRESLLIGCLAATAAFVIPAVFTLLYARRRIVFVSGILTSGVTLVVAVAVWATMWPWR